MIRLVTMGIHRACPFVGVDKGGEGGRREGERKRKMKGGKQEEGW